MPYRTDRRSGLTRVPLRLVILAIVAIAALAAMGCGEGDGLTPFEPDAGIAGTWVRYQPVPPYTRDVAATRFMASTYRDTIELQPDGRGRWSHEVLALDGPPVRRTTQVVLQVEPPFLFLNDVSCLSCEAPVGDRARIAGPPAAPRRETRAPGPYYRIVRDGRDFFELRSLYQPEDVQFFHRLGVTPGTE